MHKRWWIGVILVIITVVVVGVLLIANYPAPSSIEPQKNLPRLSASLLTLYGKQSTLLTLNVSIDNGGGEATDVSLGLVSDAFEQTSKTSIDVPANQTVVVSLPTHINDVSNGPYTVTITYEYSGTSGENASSFYVVPSVEITGIQWYRQLGYPVIPEKSTIGKNDNTTLYFNIKSDASKATYTGLSLIATPPQTSIGLTINPLSLDAIGPQGTSKQYSLGISSHNTPNGQYTIEIQVMSGQYVAYDTSVVLWVSS